MIDCLSSFAECNLNKSKFQKTEIETNGKSIFKFCSVRTVQNCRQIVQKHAKNICHCFKFEIWFLWTLFCDDFEITFMVGVTPSDYLSFFFVLCVFRFVSHFIYSVIFLVFCLWSLLVWQMWHLIFYIFYVFFCIFFW